MLRLSSGLAQCYEPQSLVRVPTGVVLQSAGVDGEGGSHVLKKINKNSTLSTCCDSVTGGDMLGAWGCLNSDLGGNNSAP